MKFYLLTDDADTLVGMRLAGIEGNLAHSKEETLSLIEKAKNDGIGMVLVTPKVAELCRVELVELKKLNKPLIVEIPDSNPDNNPADSVSDYIRDAVGIKI